MSQVGYCVIGYAVVDLAWNIYNRRNTPTMTAPDKAEEEYNFGLYLRTLQSSRHSEYIFNMTVSSVTGTADFFSLYSDMPDTIKRMENM